ncbi:MAG: amino acid adenylation domain-containing protein, partial [Anaerolineales bacterium]|nr:amino acid adenylation domain-containing protein [Anaerolineales bacterium]
LAEQDFSGAQAYWQNLLKGFTAPTPLPVERSRAIEPAGLEDPNYMGHAEQSIQLSTQLTAELKVFAEAHQLTLNTLIQGAWALLLGRYSGEPDVVFGSTRACRRSVPKELQDLAGPMVNTLPVRVDVSPDRAVLPWLKALRQQWVRLRDYEHSPPLQVQQWSDLPPGAPLFESIVNFDYRSIRAAPGSQGSNAPTRAFDLVQNPGYPLALTAFGDAQMPLSIMYDPQRFDGDTIGRMLGHLETLLQGMLANPDGRIGALPILTQPELRTLMAWSGKKTPYPADRCVHQLFEEQAARTPQAIAVVFGGQELTYSQLNARANQAAHYLREMGVGKGALVGLCMPRSAEMVIGMLGILKAGGAYVPLDPSYPKERLVLMLHDCGAGVILSQGEWRQVLPEVQAQVLSMDAWPAATGEGSAENPPNQNQADDLAYVMYTSGSTGTPKGIGIPHRAINRLVCNTDYVKLSPEDRIAQASNASFDAVTFEVWGALLNGARLVGVEQEVVLSPAAYAQRIREAGINVLFVTTALFNQIAATKPDAFKTARDVIFGGEAASPEALRRVLQAGPPERLVNGYGPTESTTFAAWELVERVEAGAKSIPIGRPIANTQLYVLDREMNPTPVGVAGELFIGGDGLALGYHRRPELTAERFVPNPFSAAGERLYRTGDLVRYLADGRIEFLGRIDHQVKLRGFRIELGEIEVVLSERQGVKQVAVLMREDQPGDKRLVAYLSLERGANLGATELRAYLKTRLPEYMLPAAFVFLDELPLNPNGKVDRKALPAPAMERTGAAYLAPRDDLEKRLCQLWEDLLGVRPVGVRDDFFELGGHSLLAVRLFNRIEQELGRRLPLAMLFRSPTVEELVLALRQGQGESEWSALVPIQPGGSRPPLFLVHPFAGETLRYAPLAQRLAPDQPVYGLQARGLRSDDEPHTTIEAMAHYYLAAVRAQQPHGPYFLGGYCLGGVVAYEMARLLQAQGEPVGLVALIESVAPVRARDRWLRRVANLARNFPLWLRDFLRLNAREIKVAVRRRFRIIGKGLTRQLGRQDRGQLTPLDLVGEQISHYPEHQRRLMEIHLQALMNYVPQDYAGRVTLFRVRGASMFKYRDPDYGWGQTARGGVSNRIVAGTHDNLVDEPYVQSLAQEIKNCLEAPVKSY